MLAVLVEGFPSKEGKKRIFWADSVTHDSIVYDAEGSDGVSALIFGLKRVARGQVIHWSQTDSKASLGLFSLLQFFIYEIQCSVAKTCVMHIVTSVLIPLLILANVFFNHKECVLFLAAWLLVNIFHSKYWACGIPLQMIPELCCVWNERKQPHGILVIMTKFFMLFSFVCLSNFTD